MQSSNQQEELEKIDEIEDEDDLQLDSTINSSSTTPEKTSNFAGESRLKLLEELRELGVNVQAFESLSIGELSDLLYGLNRAISSSKRQDVKIHKSSTEKDNLLPVLSLSDKKIIKSLISSKGHVSSLKLSKDLEIPLSTVQRRRKRLEELFLEASYELRVEKFGWRRATLFLSTQKGLTSPVAKELLTWKESILSVCRTMGANEIDLQVEFIFKHNSELLNVIEKIRTIEGIKNVTWNESIEVVGTNPNQFEVIIDAY